MKKWGKTLAVLFAVLLCVAMSTFAGCKIKISAGGQDIYLDIAPTDPSGNPVEKPTETTITMKQWVAAMDSGNFTVDIAASMGDQSVIQYIEFTKSSRHQYQTGTPMDGEFYYAQINGLTYKITKEDTGYVAREVAGDFIGGKLGDINNLRDVYSNLVYDEATGAYKCNYTDDNNQTFDYTFYFSNGSIQTAKMIVTRSDSEVVTYSFYDFGTTVIELPKFTIESDKPVVSDNTLTIGVPDNIAVTDYETNKLTLWLEEQMGVDLKFVRFTNGAGSADYLQKLSSMNVNGKTLPDIVWGINTNDNAAIRDLGEQGAFIDLTDLIEQYAPIYKEKLAELNPAMQQKVVALGTTDDGAFYGMPRTGAMGYDSAMSYMWINTVWLDKLNLEKPKTLAELYVVLEAFKTQDPNGNGIADEIPMAGMHHNLTAYIANAFLYHGPYAWLNGDEDGEIYASVTSDAYRQALIVLNDMFKKGYITTESATIEDYAKWRAYIQPANKPYNVVGMFAANPVLSTNKGDLRFLEYEAVTELASEEGYDGGWYYYSTPGVQFTTFITKDCAENKRALAMQVIDFMYSDEFVARARHGEYGVDWEFVGKNFENAENGERIIDISIGDGKAFTEGNRTWGAMPACIGTNKNQVAAAVPTTNVWQAHYDKVTAPLREYIYEVELPEIITKDFDLNEKEQEVWDDCWNLLDACFRSWRSAFMTNVKDPNNDAHWNAYLAEMERLGLSRLLEACQSSFDRMNSK